MGSRVVCNAAVDERGVYRLVELIAGGGEEQAVVSLLLFGQAVVVDVLQKVQDRVGVLFYQGVDGSTHPPQGGGIVAGLQECQQGEQKGVCLNRSFHDIALFACKDTTFL